MLEAEVTIKKSEQKRTIATYDSDLVKDIIKIRLHMWELKKNYPREEEDMKYPISNQKTKGRQNRTCTKVSNSTNSIQNKR